MGTSRQPDAIPDKIDGVTYLPLDLRDERSIEACVVSAGPIDVLINNAGESQVWPAADTPVEKIRSLFETNLFGQIKLIQCVLSDMARRRHGLIINVGSMTGKFAVPFQSAYSASKFALAGFTWSLRNEVKSLGVKVVMLEPGHIRTGIEPEIYAAPASIFQENLRIVVRSRRNQIAGGSAPDVVAKKTWAIMKKRNPAPFYASGGKAPLMVFAKRFLSDRLVEKIIAKIYGLKP